MYPVKGQDATHTELSQKSSLFDEPEGDGRRVVAISANDERRREEDER